MIKKTVWLCEYCEEYYLEKFGIIEHEKKCRYNPDNKRCNTCKHYKYTCGNMVCWVGKEDEETCNGWEMK